MGCYTALDERSLQCPEDISVIGFNDMPFIDRLRPPLTTVRFPHYQLGTEAAQLLLERISGREGPVKILYLAPELVIRGSTAGRAVNPSGPALPRRVRRPRRQSIANGRPSRGTTLNGGPGDGAAGISPKRSDAALVTGWAPGIDKGSARGPVSGMQTIVTRLP